MRLKRFFHRTPAVLGTIASIIAIGGLAIGAYKALQSDDDTPLFQNEGRSSHFVNCPTTSAPITNEP